MAIHIANNNVAGVFAFFKEQLAQQYGIGEAETFARLALEHYDNIPYTQAVAAFQQAVSASNIAVYQQVVAKLQQNQPIQHILGRTEFYGMWFTVSPAVLIPRPETEEIVYHIVTDNQQQQGLHIVDFCTGSGCIAVALAKNLQGAAVSALDVSADALEVAQENAVNNSAAIAFIKADLLIDVLPFAHDSIDIIVSNPPYVPQAELAEMAANVKDYEPHLALFVPDNDPLLFYKKISNLAQTLLKSGGKLYFECHVNHAVDVVALLENTAFKNVKLTKDMSGKNRMVSAQK